MKKISFIIFCLSVLLSGCSEEKDTGFYGCKSGLYIQEVSSRDLYGNPVSYRDSTEFSFADLDAWLDEASILFHVCTMGEVVDYDRPFSLRVVPGETTAEEGEDFYLVPSSLVIKANTSETTVPVVLKRTLKVKKMMLRIKLQLDANEYFELPLDTYKNSSRWDIDGPSNSALSFVVRYHEKYKEPFYWSVFGESYFGSFTSSKYVELNKLMGWTLPDWQNGGKPGSKVSLGKFDFAARAFQKYLQEKADVGTPVMDDDGEYMQLPSDYAVNYNKYNE